jgi:hypothetical protein
LRFEDGIIEEEEDVIGGATNKIQINDKDMSKVINETANDIFGALKKRKLAPEYLQNQSENNDKENENNTQMDATEIDHANNLNLELPSATGVNFVKKPTRPIKIVTREELYRNKKKEEIAKPKTILYLLEPAQVKYALGVDMGHIVEKFTGGKLEHTIGAPNGYTLIGHKLFIYPASDKDHDTIITHKLWPLSKNQVYSLENKGTTIILRGISCAEIDDHPDIYKDLSLMGIKNWRPLAGDNRNYGGCKAECETRGNLVDVMHKWYVSGKSYSLKNGHTAQVRFDPDVKNPVQCYKCLSLQSDVTPAHYADKCNKEAKCGNCGGKAHVENYEDCGNKSFCLNCPPGPNNKHGSLDKRCPRFIMLKDEQLRAEVYNITQTVYNRLPRSRKEQYNEIVKKNVISNTISQDLSKLQKNAECQLSSYDRRFDEKSREWDGHFSSIQSRGMEIAESMRAILEETRAGFKNVNEVVNDIVEKKVAPMRDQLVELQTKTSALDEDVLRIDENMTKMNEGLNQWHNRQSKADEALLKRVSSLEEFCQWIKTNVNANGGETSLGCVQE